MSARHMTAVAVACGVAGVALAARDRAIVARMRRQLREADRIAHTDLMTGIANRAGLRAAWSTLATARPVVALLDLDGFKPVNDTHGHAAGDAVLVAVAARLRALLPGAIVARLGGDEFAVVLPGPMSRAHEQASRIGAAIATPVPVVGGLTVTVTASIGLAQAVAGDLAQALACADAAMYRAKATRAGVTVWDPRADDRTTVAADPRPATRVRALARTELMEVTR